MAQIVRVPFSSAIAICLLIAASVCYGQGTSATVTGTITDSTGATISGAVITMTDLNTGQVSKASSSGNGLYRIGGLRPGVYQATVSKDGFKSLVKDGIELHIEDQVSLNYSLDVGSVAESVTVEAGASLVENESPTMSQVIEGVQVEQTPLNGRNVMNLVALTPGVVPQGGTTGSTSNNQDSGMFTNAFGWNNYQIGGGLAGQSSEYLDGSPLNIIDGHTSALVPTQDAIAEFRVESSVVDPRYGAFGGGVVSFATKSGTSKVHGTAYEYLRNTVFDANNFFSNLASQPRTQLIQNQYGLDLGGPIGRGGKAFFFSSWEGYRLAQGVPNSGRVPTPAELGGDFRGDAPIYNPLTGQQFSCGTEVNVICPYFLDPTSNYIGNTLKYWPTPNANIGNGAINFVQNGKAGSSNDQFTERVDWSLGTQHKIFARYTWWTANQQPTQFIFGTQGPSSTPAGTNKTKQLVLGDTVTPNGSTAIDLRLSYLRFVTETTPSAMNVDLSPFGPFYAAIQHQATYSEFPMILVNGTLDQPYFDLDVTNGGPFDNYAVSGSVTRVLGRHTLSYGGEARRMEEYINQTATPTGGSYFYGLFTGGLAPGAGASPIADFDLGMISQSLGFGEITIPSTVNNYGGVYANDTFQYKPRITLTYGLRWEMPGGYTEKHDRNTVLLPNLADPLQLVNSSAYSSRSDLEAHRTLFSPRLGFAFRANANTTLRGGYSLVYVPQDAQLGGPATSPVNAATTIAPLNGLGTRLSNPLGGTTTLLQPAGRSFDPASEVGQSISGRIPYGTYPYIHQWNGNVERMLGQSAAIQVGYLGSLGLHMPEATINLNQVPDKYLGLPATQLSQTLRPYPQYQSVTAGSAFVGDTYYNSLQASFTKHFKGGGTLLANYTFSRLRGDVEAVTNFLESNSPGTIQDYNNIKGSETSLLSYDIPQRLVINYAVDLPFGNGKKYLANSNPAVRQIVSGWNASGITTFASGFPMVITGQSNTLSSFGAGTIRPNYVAGCSKALDVSLAGSAEQGKPVLNAACFTQPGATNFGNEPRVDPNLRMQGSDDWDFSLGKTAHVHENLSVTFKAEAFNVFNRVQFGEPNTTTGGALYGVISSQFNQPRLMQFSLRMNY